MLFLTKYLLLYFVGGALVSSAPTYLQMLFLKTNFYVGALEIISLENFKVIIEI